MTITLDTASAEKIVNSERAIYVHEVDGMQREKRVLLNGQPYNNALLLGCNIVMAGLFFYVTSLNASSVLPPSVAWAQPLVGGVSAIGAGCLMYGTNAIAYKLPTIKDPKTAIMMWSVWLAMLLISAVTSAFLALLLVNGADSELDSARSSMNEANRVAGIEITSVATATKQLDTWSDTNTAARTSLAEAATNLAAVNATYSAWSKRTMAEWGQGTEASNRRLHNTKHPEHAPHIDAIKAAKENLKRFESAVTKSATKVEEWTGKLETAQAMQRTALTTTKALTVTETSPWDETMSDMASMMAIFGLNFVNGDQFKATFAVFFALTLTLAPPFWSYQTGASVAPEVTKQADRMSKIEEAGKEMRKSGAPGAGGAAGPVGGAGGGVVPGPAPTSSVAAESDSMGGMVNLALGISKGDENLQCGLTQADYERLYRLNYERVLRILEDAENRLVAHTGENQLKKKYGGRDNVAKMLKHVLVLEGHGEYATDGSVILFNPAAG